MTNNRFITLDEVIDRVCLSKTYIYRKIKLGDFPKPVPLGPYKVAFLESEIEEWIAARLEARELGEGLEERRQRALHSANHTQHVQNKSMEGNNA